TYHNTIETGKAHSLAALDNLGCERDSTQRHSNELTNSPFNFNHDAPLTVDTEQLSYYRNRHPEVLVAGFGLAAAVPALLAAPFKGQWFRPLRHGVQAGLLMAG
ncbi:unnamed protein product, partial [Chrysoparadoxa australica]